jgi:hypothetical protein
MKEIQNLAPFERSTFHVKDANGSAKFPDLIKVQADCRPARGVLRA